MERLARMSLGNRALILLITLAAAVFGIFGAASLKRELQPSLQLPMAMVSAQYQGASPEVVQSEVTEPLEEAVKGVTGVTSYTATSSNGTASVQVEFEYGDDTEDVVRSLQQAVDQIGPQLPEDVEPNVSAFGTNDIPVVMISVSAGDNAQKLAEPLRDQVVPELESIEGVRGAQLTGIRESTVIIRPDADELEDENLTATDVTNAVQASGQLSPGGEITKDGETLTATTGDRLDSIKDIKNIWVASGGGGAAAGAGAGAAAGASAAAMGQGSADPVQLKDVADVELKQDEATSITRTNGEPSLGIMVTKTADGNTVQISDEVQSALDELQPTLGEDVEFAVPFDQAPFIEQSIESMLEEGGLGLAFAVLVILLFLLSLRSTLVTAVSIPVSLLIALIGLWGFGYTLNILTLGALTVAVGRVVDDSIVVLENIKRHLGYGEAKREAILTGVREVASAVTSATLTTIAVFLPMAFVGGMVGEMFRPFAVTVSLALAASLVVSLTIIPVLCYWFMRPKDLTPEQAERLKSEEHHRELRTPLQRMYVPLIRWTTKGRLGRWVSVVVAVGVFAATMMLAGNLQTGFLGSTGQNTLSASQEFPTGTSLEEADGQAKKVEETLDDFAWIESYQASISGGGAAMGFGGGGSALTAQYTITTTPGGAQEEYKERLTTAMEEVDTETPPVVQSAAATGGSELAVNVQADDPDTLRDAAAEVEDAVRGIDGAENVENSVAAAQPALDVKVNGEDAADEGLTQTRIAQAVTAAFQGSDVGTAVVEDVQRDMVLRVDDAPETVGELRDLEIDTPTGDTVELRDVADVEEVKQPPELTSTDGVLSATVSASPTAEDLGAVSQELTSTLADLDLPEGATAELGGVSTDQTEAFAQLGYAMLAAIVLVFLIMVATFKSLIQPVILLVSIPFAATGAIGLLLATGIALDLPAMIGALMLIGIVVTNAIVLIDLVNQYRSEDMELKEAVVEGARHRLRPILMTALATIGALTPMALGITGGGAFISQPLAVVVIGGLISSTLLTLILVPVLYTMAEQGKLNRAKRREERRRRRRAKRAAKAGKTEESQEEQSHPREPDSVGSRE